MNGSLKASHKIELDKNSTISDHQIQESFQLEPAPEMRRCYTDWRGQNTILCKGRVIGGPEVSKLYRTLALVLVPSILFDIYVAGAFSTKYNENNVMIFGVILPILCGLTLLKTAFTDPGIIPRKETVQRIPRSR